VLVFVDELRLQALSPVAPIAMIMKTNHFVIFSVSL
jgi:hypothetical protein